MVLQGGFLVGIADLLLGGFGVDVECRVVVNWRGWPGVSSVPFVLEGRTVALPDMVG